MTKRITALVLAVALLFALTACNASKAGAVNLTVEVTFPDGTVKNYEINTDAEYLRGALEEAKLVEGEESQHGLYVRKVDGVSDKDGYYWAFYKDGEYLMTGVDTTPIADGDHFEIKLESYE